MFRSCFCCFPARSFSKTSARGRSLPEDVPTKTTMTVASTIAAPIKRKYMFHNSVVRHRRRNKNRKKLSLNHTMFIVPSYVPQCMPTIMDIESPVNTSRATFSVTVVPEIRQQKQEQQKQITDELSTIEYDQKSPDTKNKSHQSSIDSSQSNISTEIPDGGAILETQRVNSDERLIRVYDKHSLSHTSTSINHFIKPNVQLHATSVDPIQSHNNKPIAEVKPTTSVMQPPTGRRRSTGAHLKKQEKRSSEMATNFTPFNEPQKALQLVSAQINSPEWEAAVTGLQNISRLSMFHGKELRSSSLQPFARTVAKHIKSLRSQVARAACTAAQKMFSYVPKSVESDAEEIASALFPRMADTNKFLRVQSSEAFNAMVDNINPIKCVHVITSKGIKHGNRLIRAEACRLLARVVDKLGVSGTLHLPIEARDSVITAATSMVFDNTPTSRQAAQHILAKLSEDPRGMALISSAASPNVKATLNKSLSRIFLK